MHRSRLALLLTLALSAVVLVALPAAAHQPISSTDVSATTTTDPAGAEVYEKLVQLPNTGACAEIGSEGQFEFKTEGSLGDGEVDATIPVASGVTLTITGNKTDGYSVSLTGGTMSDILLKSNQANHNWYHFHPAVRSATPLFTGTHAGLSHLTICWTPGAPSTALSVSSPASGAITVYEGDPVNLTFSEANDGDFDLTNAHLTSDDTACDDSLAPANVAVLAVGANQSFTCTTAFATEGVYTVTVFGHGTHDGKDVTYCEGGVNPDPSTIICDQDEIAEVTITVLRPSTDLNLDPSNSELTVVNGDDATLRFIEHNDSDDNTPLTNVFVEVVDGTCNPDPLTLVLMGADGAADNADGILDPGEKWAFECTVSNVTADTTIKVVGHGTTPLGDDVTWVAECETGTQGAGIFCDVTEQAEATITVLTPSTTLTIDNGDDPIVVPVGTPVTLSFSETNDGDVDLTSPSITVDNCTAIFSSGDDGDGILNVGETWVFACEADTSVAGSTTYTATGHGTDPLGRDVTFCGAGVNGEVGSNFCDEDEQDSIVVEVFEQGEGCTPGYWRNHLDSWAATGYAPGDQFNDVFGTDFSQDITLEQAINWKGGQLNAVVRHITAALLNAAHPDVSFAFTEAQVLQLWEDAQSDPQGVLNQLVPENEAGCPIS